MPIKKTADKGIPAERRRKIAERKKDKEASDKRTPDYLADMSHRVKTSPAEA